MRLLKRFLEGGIFVLPQKLAQKSLTRFLSSVPMAKSRVSEEFLEQKSLVLAGEWRKNEKEKKAMDFHSHSDVNKAWYIEIL